MSGEVRTPSLVVPFQLRGFTGEVKVYYEENTDSERWGCHFLTAIA